MPQPASSVQLPSGWFWMFDHYGYRQRWLGHISGARLVVLAGPEFTSSLVLPEAILAVGDTLESRSAAQDVETLLIHMGYSPAFKAEKVKTFRWDRPDLPLALDGYRATPPFEWRSDQGRTHRVVVQ